MRFLLICIFAAKSLITWISYFSTDKLVYLEQLNCGGGRSRRGINHYGAYSYRFNIPFIELSVSPVLLCVSELMIPQKLLNTKHHVVFGWICRSLCCECFNFLIADNCCLAAIRTNGAAAANAQWHRCRGKVSQSVSQRAVDIANHEPRVAKSWRHRSWWLVSPWWAVCVVVINIAHAHSLPPKSQLNYKPTRLLRCSDSCAPPPV